MWVKRGTVLLVTTVGLAYAIAAPAVAQFNSPRATLQGPTQATAMDARLENIGKQLAQIKAQSARIASFDAAWPVSAEEYKAMGKSGVLLVSVVVRDPAELPLRQVYVRANGHDAPLQRIFSRRVQVAADSAVATTVGTTREDDFYILPATLALQQGATLIDFATARQEFHLNTLPFSTPAVVAADRGGLPGPMDDTVLQRFLRREYPGFFEGP